uniref:Uncharacterized protein n=1 Tax=Romanomermis culicivorax TaxID=13658 RepID=A0A915JXC1_ROMCU
MQQPGKN